MSEKATRLYNQINFSLIEAQLIASQHHPRGHVILVTVLNKNSVYIPQHEVQFCCLYIYTSLIM